jgi:uncharacterized membrane protein
MKRQEIILDIIGVIAIILSLGAYFFYDFDFYQSTIIGVFGLALFVLKGSVIRKLVTDLVEALIEKLKK